MPVKIEEEPVTKGVPPELEVSAAVHVDGSTVLIRVDKVEGGLNNGEQIVVWIGLDDKGSVYASGVKNVNLKRDD